MRKMQAEIIKNLKVSPKIYPEKEIRTTVDYLKSYIRSHSNLTSLVLGISGGQDSTLAGRLSEIAMTELRSETGDDKYRFLAIRLPYGIQKDNTDVDTALQFIQPDKIFDINIKNTVDAMVQDLNNNEVSISDFNKGNIKSRSRMIAQYAIAGANNGIVVGTDHASEAVTGFYTKFGDGGVDIVPLWRLNKRQGKELLMSLKAPADLYLKTPTADLEDNHPLLSDEEALGVSYKDIDDYLEGKNVSVEAAEKIENLYLKTEHKRTLPYTIWD